MSSRDDILTAVRDHAPAKQELPPVPDFRRGPDDLVNVFTAALARLDGKVITQPPSAIQDWLSTAYPDAHRICSAVSEVSGNAGPPGFSGWAAPADIGGITVHPAQGVTTLTVVLSPRTGEPSPDAASR